MNTRRKTARHVGLLAAGLLATAGCAPSLRLVSTTAEPLGDRRIPEAIAFVSAIDVDGFEGQLIYEVRLLDARFRPVRSGNGRFQNQSGEVTARKTLMVSQSPWKFENEAVAIPVPELEINAGMLPLVAEFLVRPSVQTAELSARQLVMIPVNIYSEPETGSPQLVWGEYPRTAETERLKAIAAGKQPATEPRQPRRRRETRSQTADQSPPRDAVETAAAPAPQPEPPAEQPAPDPQPQQQVADAPPPSPPPAVAPQPTEARGEVMQPARTTPRPRRAPYTRPPRTPAVPGDVQPPPRFTGLPPYRERDTTPEGEEADSDDSSGSPGETAPAPQDGSSVAAPRPPVVQREQQALLTPASRGGRRSFDERNAAAKAPARRAATTRPPQPNHGESRDGERPTGDDVATRDYRVVKGDSLHRIARRELGDEARWEEVFLLNWDRLEAPDDLAEGMVLRLPAADSATNSAAP